MCILCECVDLPRTTKQTKNERDSLALAVGFDISQKKAQTVQHLISILFSFENEFDLTLLTFTKILSEFVA